MCDKGRVFFGLSFGSSCDSSENVSRSSKHLQMQRVTAVAQTESSHTSNSPGKTSDDNGNEQNERSTSASSGNNDDNAVSHSFTFTPCCNGWVPYVFSSSFCETIGFERSR